MYVKATSAPAIGSARETETLDFKHRLKFLDDRKTIDQVDIAISAAAFANRRGGNLLFGASQGGDEPLSGFAPLTPEEVDATHGACDKAIKSRCDPSPQWSSTTIPHSGGSLLAIHVEPYPSAVVAARVPGDKARGYGGDAYVFPLRVGSQTNYLTASQLPMYMDPKVRRTLLLLSRISKGEAVVIAPRSQNRFQPDKFNSVDEEQNVVIFEGHRIALDQIESVWGAPGKWYIQVLVLWGTYNG